MITLPSEALCFITYLSSYLYRNFQLYFFLFLKFYLVLMSVFTCENTLLVIFLSKLSKSFADVSIYKKNKKFLIILANFEFQNLTVSTQIWLFFIRM